MNQQLLYQIAITKIPLVGAVTAKQLISYCGSAEAVFSASKRSLLRIPGVGPQIAGSILRHSTLKEAEQELRFLETHSIQAFSYLDRQYPQRLRQYNDCPLVLYYKGQASLNPQRAVAIVGTRKPSPYGRRICAQLVEELHAFDVLLISGLAYGIDVTAHKKCLELGVNTVGVLGHGLHKIYPAAHRAVARQMIDQGGLLTEYASYVEPDREHFPMRNRIIAGMCDALIVVETGPRGGSMISAEIANGYHKDVFAIPGRPKDQQSMGCNQLIKAHKAALIESATDLAALMRWDSPPQTGIQKELFVNLDTEEQQIVDLLRQHEEIGIDRLTALTTKSTSQMASLLLQLEFKGLLRVLPGKRYMLS
ncbi:MAG: DNA-processing protein DprA [Bacteroidota bacterium]